MAKRIREVRKDGSSPRVRGTHICGDLAAFSCRFIPACAGNATGQWPRCVALDGSSPRVRGTL